MCIYVHKNYAIFRILDKIICKHLHDLTRNWLTFFFLLDDIFFFFIQTELIRFLRQFLGENRTTEFNDRFADIFKTSFHHHSR